MDAKEAMGHMISLVRGERPCSICEEALARLQAMAEENATLKATRTAELERSASYAESVRRADEENERRKESSNALIKMWREIAEKAEAELARWKPLIEAAKTKCSDCPFGLMLKEYEEDDNACKEGKG